MTATLVLTAPVMREIEAVSRLPMETAGVLFVSVARAPSGDIRVLGRAIRWVEPDAYALREEDALSIRSEGYVPWLGEAETIGAACIWVHTHPGDFGRPLPSAADVIVDGEIAGMFRARTASSFYGALIFSPRDAGVAFSGYLEDEDAERVALERLWVVGDRLRLVLAFDAEETEVKGSFDRNVRAFGGGVQRTLARLRVGIVGCGGTGSAVAEQLARLGVRGFTLIDPDTLSASNVTRVYGSFPDQIGRHKVEVTAEHLTRIAPDANCRTVRSMITVQSAARELTACDLVFGCTDDNAGRLILSRLATYMLTPVIDCGVLLSSGPGGDLRGIDGRVTYIGPAQACLVCRGRIDLARASAELLTPEERVRLADEGYAPALGAIEPAVVTFTSLVAATAVTEMLERLIGFGPTPPPNEMLLRVHDRAVSSNLCVPREGHYCDPGAGKLGRGVTQPFLDQTWTT